MLSLVMAQLSGYVVFLWVMGVILPLAVVLRIWMAGLISEYPALFRYNAATAIGAVAMSVAARFMDPATNPYYCYLYWGTALAADFFALAVMLEIFRDIFKPYEALRLLGNVLFRWTLGVLVVVSTVSALTAGTRNAVDVINRSLMTFDRGLEILQCGIVLFLLLTYKHLGISFRHRVFGIACGFGVYASINLMALSVFTWASPSVVNIASSVANTAGILGYVIWLGYFFIPQPERRMSEAMPESRRWEYALASIQAPAPEGMFLSSIDRTVERLLTKNNVATQQKPKEDKHWFGD